MTRKLFLVTSVVRRSWYMSDAAPETYSDTQIVWAYTPESASEAVECHWTRHSDPYCVTYSVSVTEVSEALVAP